MKFTLDADSYRKAVDAILSLIGNDVDCAISVKEGKVHFEASRDEAWIRLPLKTEEVEGTGKVFTKIEYLKIIKTGKSRTLSMAYEGNDNIVVSWGRARGALRLIDEEDSLLQRPEYPVSVSAAVPAKIVKFATIATAFRPLLDSSQPNAIIKVDKEEFSISSYDAYIGTHYGTNNEEIRVKERFNLSVEMSYWKNIVTKIEPKGTVRLGADEHNFRIKTDSFDLYHAVIQEDTQDVKEVITTLRAESGNRAVIEFDGKAVTEAIDATKGIVGAADKDESCFYITINKEKAILAAESSFGEMEADFDITGFDGEDIVEFRVSASAFSDVLRLTRDEALKYGPVRLTLTEEHLVLESLKVPSSSISPVLGE